ncbi:indole-3-glycerol-phosphate synthase [Methanococcoides sp. FTZ1]|uniref:indole-3-glycerol-phosphate synthase n=1 Tax=Methanococcoides sp. FTZ1 TaxID=3439061 RepID=UPI003F85C051
MHSIIHDIINSTETRVRELHNTESDEVLPFISAHDTARNTQNIINSILSKKQEGKAPIISEVKPASPSMKIRKIDPAEAKRIAMEMERAGAAAISVLTEPEFFEGSIENLRSVRENVALPVLRKDFIIDKAQFDEVKSDLILLIAGILNDKLEEFIQSARSKGFEPLVEVHNKEELLNALETSAKIIGINNRDLTTMKTDISTTEELIPLIKEHDSRTNTEHLIISESGVHTTDDVRRMISSGADAILIGTSIVKNSDIYNKTKELVDALETCTNDNEEEMI